MNKKVKHSLPFCFIDLSLYLQYNELEVVITMKLNNRGWGLGVFLLFLFLFFIVILVIANVGKEVSDRLNYKNTVYVEKLENI